MQSWMEILDHTVPFLLVFFRMLGLFLAAPLLSSAIIPRQVKVLIALMLSAAVYPMLRTMPDPAMFRGGTTDILSLVPMIVAEGLIGYSIGMIASVPLSALEMSGVMMGQQMGLGLARVYNPEADYDVDVLGQMLFYLATGVFFAMGGLEILMRALIRTFDTIPIGGLMGEARGGVSTSSPPLELLVGVVQSAFDLAIRVASPVAGIVLLLVIVFAAIGKTMPQINIMSVGFTIKIVAGTLMIAAAVYTIQSAAGHVMASALRQIEVWAEGVVR